MDPHVHWLRTTIARSVAKTAARWLTVTTLAAAAALFLVFDSDLAGVLPWAFLAGQSVLALGIVRAALSNPISWPYLSRVSQGPRRFQLLEDEPPVEITEGLLARQLEPLVSLGDKGIEGVSVDLFQTPRQTVTMARSRQTDCMSLFSRLSDGRILVTDSVLAVPHSRLAVNLSPGADAKAMIRAHREAIDALADRGVAVVADDGLVFIDALGLEHEALQALGPALGPFLNLTAANRPLRFLTPLDTARLDEMSMDRSASGEVGALSP